MKNGRRGMGGGRNSGGLPEGGCLSARQNEFAIRWPPHLISEAAETPPQNHRKKPMSKITPCLSFDGQAEEAARFYVSLLPDSRIDRVNRSPIDTPSGPAGTVLFVEFTL